MTMQKVLEQADLVQQINKKTKIKNKKMAKSLTFAIFCGTIKMVGKIKND